MNVELLEKVKKAILKNPKHFDMRNFGNQYFINFANGIKPPKNCETAACIAGWAIVLSDENQKHLNSHFAGIALDLTYEQKECLFYVSGWPFEFSNAFVIAEIANNYKRMAQVAAERIDFFIQTNGTDKKPRKPKAVTNA